MSGEPIETGGGPAARRPADPSEPGSLLGAASGAPAEDILASIADAIVAVDDAWRLTYRNSAAERLRIGQADQASGTIFAVLSTDPDGPFQRACAESKTSGEPVAFTAYADILGAWLEVGGFPHPGGYTFVLRDVSQLRDAQRSLHGSERQIEAARSINQRIFETSLDLILVVDRKGNFIRVNPSSEAILGYRPDELVGHNAVEFIYRADLESTRNEMRLARRGRLMRNFESRYVHRNGRIVPLVWTGIWSEPDQQHFFIGRDMTERIAAEELRQAQKIEAIGQLTGGIAHDFNNILTVVIGNLDMMVGTLPGDSETQRMGSAALRGAQRAAEVTRQLLAFGRRQPLDPKPINVNWLVAEMTETLARTLGDTIDIGTVLSDELWWCTADPDQLQTAVLHLASNARDAMPRGGRLALETTNLDIDGSRAAHYLGTAPGAYVMLSVSDTGAGIPNEHLGKVFEPFFTTKEIGKGSGLGLAHVYGFVKQSGGHVTIYSEVGVGTTIRIYLPRQAMAKEPARPRGRTGEALRARGTELVLVVEDDLEVRRYSVETLKSLGYRVLEAGKPMAALKEIESRNDIDLMFTDVGLPGMNGSALADEGARRRPSLKVLFTTGYAGRALAAESSLRAGSGILQKPFTRDEFAAQVRASLDGQAVP